MTDADVFFSGYDPPVVVVTARSTDGPAGCLVGFTTQCSIHPPRLLVCLSVLNHTHEVARSAETLGVHLLGDGQHDLASLFAEVTGDAVDKFAQVEWRPGVSGTPMLSHCAAYLEGGILKRVALGDHDAFLLEVLDVGVGDATGSLRQSDVRTLDAGHPADEVLSARHEVQE